MGCERVEELTLEAPLVLPESGGVQVQVSVGAVDEGGRCAFALFSRSADSAVFASVGSVGSGVGSWVRHASGFLAGGGVVPLVDVVWPPVGAESVVLEGLYEGFAGAGLVYGEAFRGLRGVWRRGGETFAEVVLPELIASDAGGFGVHPALLDAALHALGVGGLEGEGQARLPFAWGGVSLHAAGASVLRVRLAPVGTDAVSLHAVDT
ncbi:polyketide synthase dehydratase domain-containing protein, partial [Streptomyces sp. bgisy100]|uniref:polyketide synthase dehydratase domain-containing protein n=1 Tax=Streptomyces sp. bgisy100 TaxID=3413783 RepID=UPI003D75ADF9